MSEQEQYDDIAQHMNEKGKYKLANFMAHDYEITRTDLMVVVTNDKGRCIIIDTEGNQWVGQKAI